MFLAIKISNGYQAKGKTLSVNHYFDGKWVEKNGYKVKNSLKLKYEIILTTRLTKCSSFFNTTPVVFSARNGFSVDILFIS